MRVIELATKLEMSEKEIQEILKVLGLSWDDKGINVRSHVFGNNVNIEQLFLGLQEAKQQNKTTLLEAAKIIVETYKAQNAKVQVGESFSLDSYFEQTFGQSPAKLVPGSTLYLIYKNLQNHQNTGAYMVAAIYGYIQADTHSILAGKKTLSPEDMQVIEQTVFLGAEQGSTGVKNYFQAGIEKMNFLAIEPEAPQEAKLPNLIGGSRTS